MKKIHAFIIVALILAIAMLLLSSCMPNSHNNSSPPIISETSVVDMAKGSDKIDVEEKEMELVSFENELIQKSIFLTDKMIKTADNREYLLFNTTQDDLFIIASGYADIGNTAPDRAIVISFSNAAMNRMVDEKADDDYALTSTTREIIRNRLLHSFASEINGCYNGLLYMAATSIIMQTESFQKPADPEFTGYSLVILLYDVSPQDDNWTAISFVSFSSTQEETINASACFVGADHAPFVGLYDDKEYIVDNLNEAFEAFGVNIPAEGVDISIFEGEKLGSVPAYEMSIDEKPKEKEFISFENELIQKSIFLTDKMIKAGNNDAYIRFFDTTSIELFTIIKRNIEIGDMLPDRAIILSFDNSAMNVMLDEMAGDDYSLTSTSRELLRERVLQSFANTISNKYGDESIFGSTVVLAASSILRQIEAFQKPSDPEFTGYSLVILLYPHDYDETTVSFISFINSEEETILATASFVLYPSEIFTVLYDDMEYVLNSLREEFELPIPENAVDCTIYEGNPLQSIS